MKKGTIISAIVGGAAFAVPYILEMGAPFSLLIGVIAYGAGNLVFTEPTKEIQIDGKKEDFSEIISKAKKMNADILGMINRVEDKNLKDNIREIYQSGHKIINAVIKDNKKIRYVENFFTYYLPETYKLLKKYDEIENQKLGGSSEAFLSKTRDMVSKINEAFKVQLGHLYQEDMIDTNAEMKVFDSMIKADGYGESDFKL